MGDIIARRVLALGLCIALGAAPVLFVPAWANPPMDIPGQGKGLVNRFGGSGNNGQGSGGSGGSQGGAVIQNGIAQPALTNWQAMPVRQPGLTPGLIRVDQPAGPDSSDNENAETVKKYAGSGHAGSGQEKQDKVRVEVGQTHALEMMSDKVVDGSRENLYSQVINRQDVPRGNTIGRSSDGTLRIYGHNDARLQQGTGVTFEEGQLDMMDDVYQSGLK